MLTILKNWFGPSNRDADWSAVAAWALGAGHRFAKSRDGSGFVVEPAQGSAGWRLEWGAPQRHYIEGPELRLRAEVPATGDLQMLVIARPLMTVLEQEVFEDYTDGNQTRMDDGMPEEMRWLVLYPKMPRAELGELRERFGVLANLPRAAPIWLDGALAQHLAASASWRGDDHPLVMTVQRGRLTLRCLQARPDLACMRAAVALFVAALVGARRVGDELARGRIANDRPTGWGPFSAMPPPEPQRP